jgi:hypothetical protein
MSEMIEVAAKAMHATSCEGRGTTARWEGRRTNRAYWRR